MSSHSKHVRVGDHRAVKEGGSNHGLVDFDYRFHYFAAFFKNIRIQDNKLHTLRN